MVARGIGDGFPEAFRESELTVMFTPPVDRFTVPPDDSFKISQAMTTAPPGGDEKRLPTRVPL